MTDNIYRAFDAGMEVAMVFLDNSKAFDSLAQRATLQIKNIETV